MSWRYHFLFQLLSLSLFQFLHSVLSSSSSATDYTPDRSAFISCIERPIELPFLTI